MMTMTRERFEMANALLGRMWDDVMGVYNNNHRIEYDATHLAGRTPVKYQRVLYDVADRAHKKAQQVLELGEKIFAAHKNFRKTATYTTRYKSVLGVTTHYIQNNKVIRSVLDTARSISPCEDKV